MGYDSVVPAGHTRRHINCPACARALVKMNQIDLEPAMGFSQAFEAWIDRRVIALEGIQPKARYISSRTEQDLRQYARAAARFFGGLRLGDIHAGHLHSYQQLRATNPDLPEDQDGTWRAYKGPTVKDFPTREAAQEFVQGREGWRVRRTAWEHAAGANLIRKEVGTVIRVLKAAGAWTADLEESFEALQVEETDIQRAMTPEEQHRWLHTAAGREEWRVVYWWSIVALQTTMSTNELRGLRLGDVFLTQGTVQVRKAHAKNRFRMRTIPLQTPEVVWALDELMARARRLGATQLHHFVFPFHLTADRYDPERQMTAWGLRKPWDEVREASGVRWLRMYDLRHAAITRMAEAGVPLQVISSFAGHMSPKMQQHYTAISMEAKRRWAAATWAAQEMPYQAPAALPAPGRGGSGGGGNMGNRGRGRWAWKEEEVG